MAQVAITKVHDGGRNAVFHVSITGDAQGDITDEILIDPATSFDPAMRAKPTLSIDALWYDLSGFTAQLEFDYAASDTPAWSLSAGQANHLDFSCFGGLKDQSSPGDGLGKLKITTVGLGVGDIGTIVIKARKG
jgi:hypothetical protein